MSLAFSRKNENNIKFTCTQQYKKGSDEARVLYFPHSMINSIVADALPQSQLATDKFRT